MEYNDLIFKIPVESQTYAEDSAFIISQITAILDERKRVGDNKIILNTNLKLGLPLENIMILSIKLDTLTARILKLSSNGHSQIVPAPLYSGRKPADR